jgi:hypothetical protein
MNIILWYLYIFCFSIVAVGNPIILKILYKTLKEDKLYELRINTTNYIWGINDKLDKNFNDKEILHFRDVKKLLIGFSFSLYT